MLNIQDLINSQSTHSSASFLKRSTSCPELDTLLPYKKECDPIKLKLSLKNPTKNRWQWKCSMNESVKPRPKPNCKRKAVSPEKRARPAKRKPIDRGYDFKLIDYNFGPKPRRRPLTKRRRDALLEYPTDELLDCDAACDPPVQLYVRSEEDYWPTVSTKYFSRLILTFFSNFFLNRLRMTLLRHFVSV